MPLAPARTGTWPRKAWKGKMEQTKRGGDRWALSLSLSHLKKKKILDLALWLGEGEKNESHQGVCVCVVLAAVLMKLGRILLQNQRGRRQGSDGVHDICQLISTLVQRKKMGRARHKAIAEVGKE